MKPSFLEQAYADAVGRERTIPMFVLYERPRDFPQTPCVVRLWENDKPMSLAWLFSSIDAARAALPGGLHRIPRADSDDPVIVETWL